MRLLSGHKWAVRAVAYAPHDPTLLATGSDDRTVRLWDTQTGAERAVFQDGQGGILALAFAPDGGRLAVSGRSGRLLVRNIDLCRPVDALSLDPKQGLAVALAYFPDGSAVVGGLHPMLRSFRPPAAASLLLWYCDGLRPPWSPGGGGHLTALAVAADGTVAAVREDRQVILWDHPPDGDRWPFRVAHPVPCLSFVPCCAPSALALGQGMKVELRRSTDGVVLAQCVGHRGLVQALAFAPDGRTFLSGAADGTVRQWETVSGKQLAAWHWEVGPINAVAIAPDGLTAACGGDRSAVVVWDLDA